MTIDPCVTFTAPDSNHSLPSGMMISETQYVAPSGSIHELLRHCADLEHANRTLSQEAKRAAECARFQLSEIEHRLMNTFATVQALAMQSAQPGDTGEAFRAVFGARLLALARSHEFLGSRYPKGALLGLIVIRCLAPFEDKPGRITTRGPRVHLRGRDVLSVGLALHELTTNAAKHGALSTSDGQVEVTWSLEAKRVERVRSIVIIWRERGGPVVIPPSRRGFGLRLLERGLFHSSDGGTTHLDFAPSGIRCRISLPFSLTRNKSAI